MPELPEVENLRRGLEKYILGQRIVRVSVEKPKLVSGKGNVRVASLKKKEEFIKGLTGARFVAIERRAKNLIFRLQPPTANRQPVILLVHLKMSGQFVYKPHFAEASRGKGLVMGGHPIEISESELPNKHTHVTFELEKGTLYYNDTRMFGYLLYYSSGKAFEAEDHFSKLGLEPLDKAFTFSYLASTLKAKSSKLKTVLMSQEVVTGLGNIYADEAAFESGVRPTRLANSLTSAEIKKLHAAIRRIITRAIKVGGSSVATYRLLDASRGNYAREHKVYGKAGEECFVCSSSLKKIVLNGRTTVFCSQCQK